MVHRNNSSFFDTTSFPLYLPHNIVALCLPSFLCASLLMVSSFHLFFRMGMGFGGRLVEGGLWLGWVQFQNRYSRTVVLEKQSPPSLALNVPLFYFFHQIFI
ncbi:hypothetical protein AAZV13_18G061700 [Glycine max]